MIGYSANLHSLDYRLLNALGQRFRSDGEQPSGIGIW